jgi:hypothetical protein
VCVWGGGVIGAVSMCVCSAACGLINKWAIVIKTSV